eukprot:6116111-Pyramimonas_sp.AAC.2
MVSFSSIHRENSSLPLTSGHSPTDPPTQLIGPLSRYILFPPSGLVPSPASPKPQTPIPRTPKSPEALNNNLSPVTLAAVAKTLRSLIYGREDTALPDLRSRRNCAP